MRRIIRAVAVHGLVLLAFIAVAVLVRGVAVSAWDWVNPDEAEIVAQARAAIDSPVPWSTWTLGTVGPYLVLFLAFLGWLGLPLTLAFAHLLSAVVTGVIGYGLFVIVRRQFRADQALALVALAWVPLALAAPLGAASDFAAFSTEFVPCMFLVLAALVPARLLAAHPAWFAVVGVFGALAVGSKYQAAPLLLGLLIARLVMLERPVRAWGRPVLFLAAGAALPLGVIGVMLLTPAFDPDLLAQNIYFVGVYAVVATSLVGKLVNTGNLLLSQPWLLPGAAALVWLFVDSSRRVIVARSAIVAGGLLAVLAGGMGYAHYAIFVYVALGLAMGLPVRTAADRRPAVIGRRVVVAVSAVVVVALTAVSAVGGRLVLSTPADVVAALSPDSVVRVAELEELCPPGSDVLVWGWAPELYVHYDWDNTVPFLNPLGTVASRRNTLAAGPILAEGVAESDCVVDAVGPPFFGAGAYLSLTHYFPELEPVLDEDFRQAPDVLECEECAVYVRE